MASPESGVGKRVHPFPYVPKSNQNTAALRSLSQKWQNVPPSWGKTDDPSSLPWEGVSCTGSRVITLGLSNMNITGSLDGNIGQLSELATLDLSYNINLTGPLSPRIGDLKRLRILILAGCGFIGSIPTEIGDLAELSFLALNSNNFSGSIPPSLGKLSKVYWLDLSNNRLVGSIPVSTDTTPGLDLLLNTKHLVLDGNNLTGAIPDTVGLVSTLEVLSHVATEIHVIEALRLFNVSTMDAARSGINQHVNMTVEMQNEIKQAETQIKRRMGIGSHISERRLIDDLNKMGLNESVVRRALLIMHQRDEVEYRRERRVILRKA